MKTVLVDAVNAFVSKEGKVNSLMFDLLERFPNKKIVVTNANDEQMGLFGLDRLPYEVFTLKHDPEKTDPIYFFKLLERYQFRPEDVVYFEHNDDAVESARSVGILSYHYDPDKKDIKALEMFLDGILSAS